MEGGGVVSEAVEARGEGRHLEVNVQLLEVFGDVGVGESELVGDDLVTSLGSAEAEPGRAGVPRGSLNFGDEASLSVFRLGRGAPQTPPKGGVARALLLRVGGARLSSTVSKDGRASLEGRKEGRTDGRKAASRGPEAERRHAGRDDRV